MCCLLTYSHVYFMDLSNELERRDGPRLVSLCLGRSFIAFFALRCRVVQKWRIWKKTRHQAMRGLVERKHIDARSSVWFFFWFFVLLVYLHEHRSFSKLDRHLDSCFFLNEEKVDYGVEDQGIPTHLHTQKEKRTKGNKDTMVARRWERWLPADPISLLRLFSKRMDLSLSCSWGGGSCMSFCFSSSSLCYCICCGICPRNVSSFCSLSLSLVTVGTEQPWRLQMAHLLQPISFLFIQGNRLPPYSKWHFERDGKWLAQKKPPPYFIYVAFICSAVNHNFRIACDRPYTIPFAP